MKKFENLKQGKSNYRGLPSVENGYRSDHELYANVVNQRLREVGGGRSMKMTGAHDGYGSDRETFMAQQTRNTLTTSTRSPSIDQRGRSASVSTTIVRKSNNSSSSPANSPFIASRCRFLDEETNCHNFNESANSNFPVLVNNNQDLPQIGPQYSEDLSEVTKTNDVGLNCSDSQQRFQPNSLVVGDTVNSLSYQTSNSPMSCSHPSPTLSLPSKNRLTYSVPVTRHSPPALPPRVRPGQKHPSLSSISNMPISPKSHSVTPAPPSPHRSQKPPPYHIAAVYSKHIGG